MKTDRIYIMTDLEGVAGVENFEQWCFTKGRYYDRARALLTAEINAAVKGLFSGGAKSIVVSDGHGDGGVDPETIDPRVELIRGWPNGWPLELDRTYDAVAFVGQHAKASTVGAHLAHTQSLNWIDCTVNGVSIGEFGQFVVCASELGIPVIFGSGDLAFTKEAQALVPGIETVAVKWGLKSGTGADLSEEEYPRYVASARHKHPVQARELIRAGAQRAIQRAQQESFGIIPLTAPFTRVVKLRKSASRPYPTVMKVTHPMSVIGAMRKSAKARPVSG
jgi:D-amino peptidase